VISDRLDVLAEQESRTDKAKKDHQIKVSYAQEQCCRSGMFYPGSDHCSIPDPGGKKAPDPGSDLFLYKGY
jgi:hypothetical protein